MEGPRCLQGARDPDNRITSRRDALNGDPQRSAAETTQGRLGDAGAGLVYSRRLRRSKCRGPAGAGCASFVRKVIGETRMRAISTSTVWTASAGSTVTRCELEAGSAGSIPHWQRDSSAPVFPSVFVQQLGVSGCGCDSWQQEVRSGSSGGAQQPRASAKAGVDRWSTTSKTVSSILRADRFMVVSKRMERSRKGSRASA